MAPGRPASFSAPGSRSSSTDCTVLPPVFCTCTKSTRAGCDTITALTLATSVLTVDRTFLLGVGAMKAGTTWLHDYLAASPQCQPGHPQGVPRLRQPRPRRKEPWLLHRVVDKARASLDEVAAGRPTDPTYLHQAAMIADEQLYFDYFTALFAALAGDPADPRHHARATRCCRPTGWPRSAPSSSGGRCGPVAAFLMRDPVERIWSQVRMQKRRRPENNPGTAEELVAQRYAEPSYAERTRYEATVRHLDDGVRRPGAATRSTRSCSTRPPPSAELRALCGLAGIDYREPDLDARFNVSPRSAALPEETVRAVAEHYRPTYEFVASRFPDRDLPRIWPSARFVL